MKLNPVSPATPKETERNIGHARRLGFPRMGKADKARLAIVGGGPSVRGRIEELKAFDGDIWAVNGAFHWCRDNGIEAWFFSIDPTEQIATFCKGAKRAILAMECHPATFKALANAKVEAILLADMEHGATTATAGPSFGRKRGYREIHFFGCEGNYGDTTHVYGHAGFDLALGVNCAGEKFLTSGDLVMQTEFLGAAIRQHPGVLFDQSGGLLAAYMREPAIHVEEVSQHLYDTQIKPRGLGSGGGGSPRDGDRRIDDAAVSRITGKAAPVTGVLVCIPAGGQMVSMRTMESMYATCQFLTKSGVPNQLSMFSAADIEDIRNLFVTYWYETTKHSHLLFVDADMGFGPALIRDMLKFNRPLMGALYARRHVNPSVVGTAHEGHSIRDVVDGFLPATGVGCGVMMIAREVITRMIDRYPEVIDESPDNYLLKASSGKLTRILQVFDKIKTPELRLSEDMSFCHRWLTCGGEIWANVAHSISHVGPFDYHLRYQDVLELAANEAKAAA